MPKDNYSRIKLTERNNHLLDILDNNLYLELGNIRYDVMNDLLSKKLVHFSKITYFDIETKGIGSSKITKEEIKKIFPFLHLYNLNRFNRSNQLVITYGVLVRRQGYKEFFSPMILIPVNMHFIDDDLYFQMISKPFENPLIKSKTAIIDNTNFEKLDTIYALDKYCMNFVKNNTANIRLENYLTIVNTTQIPLNFNHEKFSIDSNIDVNITRGYSLNSKQDIYNIDELNKQQRIAVQRASLGKSFGILGYLGSGKTRTLINIASDAICNGKKVLYISNMDTSLQTVNDRFNEVGLDSLVVSLNSQFDSLNEQRNETKVNRVIDTIIKTELQEEYRVIDEYERINSGRIANFHFMELAKELVLIDENVKTEKIDNDLLKNINKLLKHEINEVYDSLKIIDKEIKKIPSFPTSTFHTIPINNNINNHGEVLTVLSKIYSSFEEIIHNKEKLEKKYGFSNISNSVEFKNYINSFNGLDTKEIPISWLMYDDGRGKPRQKLLNYQQAINTFPILSEEVEKALLEEKRLNQKYNLESIVSLDISKAIKDILGKYYTIEEEEKVNNILINAVDLTEKLSHTMNQIEICDKNFLKLARRMDNVISIRNIETVEQVLNFIEMLNKVTFSKAWFETNNPVELRNKLEKIEKFLNHYNQNVEYYKTVFDNLNNINSNITFLENKMRRKKQEYKNKNITEIYNVCLEIQKDMTNIDMLKNQYFGLTNSKFNPDESVLGYFDEVMAAFNNIKNDLVRKKMAKLIVSTSDKSYKEMIKPFNVFNRSYNVINETYQILIDYSLCEEKRDFVSKVNTIEEIHNYLSKVVTCNKKISEIIKEEKENITLKDYIELRDEINNFNNLCDQISDNREYIRLYEDMFKGYKTNLILVDRVINEFSSYIEIFKTNESLSRSFKEDINSEIKIILKDSVNIFDLMNSLYRDYAKYFKYPASEYYYMDFDEVILSLNRMLNSEDELKIYLKITKQMQVLLRYKLYNLNNHIINNQSENYADVVKYNYLKIIYQQYIKNNSLFTNNKTIKEKLDRVLQCEKELIESNIDIIKQRRNPRYRIANLKNLNYNDYVKKTQGIKYLYLADCQMANIFLDISLFDLVLIDDAHLLQANECSKIIHGKQVIIAGNAQMQSSVSSNITSRIRSNSVVVFHYRFTPTPFSLLKNMKHIRGNFYNQEITNQGIEVRNTTTQKDIAKIIYELYCQDHNVKINCFTPIISKIRKILEYLCEMITKGDPSITTSTLHKLLTSNINVCDLKSGYLLDANYNILDYDNYSYIEDESQTISMIDNLLSCRTKLIVLRKVVDDSITSFSKAINNLIDNPIEKHCLTKNNIATKMAKELEKHHIKTLGTYSYFTLIVEYKNINYGIVLIEDPELTEFTILNDIRDLKSSLLTIKYVWLSNIINNFTQTILDLVGEITNG